MKRIVMAVMVLMALMVSVCLCNAMESEDKLMKSEDKLMKSLSKEDQKDLKYLRRLAKSESMEDSTWAKDLKILGKLLVKVKHQKILVPTISINRKNDLKSFLILKIRIMHKLKIFLETLMKLLLN